MSSLVSQSRQVLASKAKSFRWAAVFLPEHSHNRAAVVYTFCRLLDDAVDEAATTASASESLREIELAFARCDDPEVVVGAMRKLVGSGIVPLGAVQDLIAGVKSDIGLVRVHNDGDLLRYSYRVAGTVGLMMCGVLDVRDTRAHAHAIDLGIAMQLTNICRDVAEDAARGRVYLPAARLRAAGTSPEAVVRGDASAAAVAQVVRDLLELAEDYYRSADAGMRYIPPRPRLAILVAARLYRGIGRRLLRHGGDALRGRTIVPRWQKLGYVLGALLLWPWLTWRRRYLQPHRPTLHAELTGVSPSIS